MPYSVTISGLSRRPALGHPAPEVGDLPAEDFHVLVVGDLVELALGNVHPRRDVHPPRVALLAQDKRVDIPHIHRYLGAELRPVRRQDAVEISHPQRCRLANPPDRHLGGRVGRLDRGVELTVDGRVPLRRDVVLPLHVRLVPDEPQRSRVRLRRAPNGFQWRMEPVLTHPYHLGEARPGSRLRVNTPVQIPARGGSAPIIVRELPQREGRPHARRSEPGDGRSKEGVTAAVGCFPTTGVTKARGEADGHRTAGVSGAHRMLIIHCRCDSSGRSICRQSVIQKRAGVR